MKSVHKTRFFTISGIFVGLAIVGLTVYSAKHACVGAAGDGVETDWRQLGELDIKTGAAPDSLKKLNGTVVIAN